MAAVLPSWEYNFVVSAFVLLVLAIVLHIYNKHINPYMKWDKKEEPEEKKEKTPVNQPSTMKVFIKSGFFFVCVAVLLSITVSQSKSTLSSIMFVENYKSVSPFLGNILTIVFVLSGIVGTIVAKRFCDKVRNELVAMALTLIVQIPLLSICIFVGNVPMVAIVIVLAVVAALESIASLFRNYYNVHFVKYGKSGTAAGILNAAMSLSYMLAAYVMPKTVEVFSWKTYLTSLPILIGISALLLLVVCRTFKNFKRGQL
jgi:predicted MFS family arabinose efflux permease